MNIFSAVINTRLATSLFVGDQIAINPFRIRFALFFEVLLACFLAGAGVATAQGGSGDFVLGFEVVHPCGGALGRIDVVLNGSSDDYTYYWVNGLQGLHLEGLSGGTYTFVIRDKYGCEQTYDVVLFEFVSCVVSADVLMSDKYCEAMIVLHVTDENGNPLPEELLGSLNVTWEDGDVSGLIREVSGAPFSSVTYYVNVSMQNAEGAACCSSTIGVLVEFGNCNGFEKCQLVVNEVHRSGNEGSYQFVELLVVGDGLCGDSCDLRGYKVDDNNGYLIRGNEYVNEYNKGQIGIDAGYIEFSDSEVWSAVPNGSLIVLYGNRSDLPIDFPSDDAVDGDGDGVYVLPVNQSGAFEGRGGVWNQDSVKMDYAGWPVAADWSLIRLSVPADGMQVRDPSGTYMHGVSTGESPYAIEGAFDLWLGALSMSDMDIRLTGMDWTAKESFTSLAANASIASPGMPNSVENDSLIASLRHCDTTVLLLTSRPEEVYKEEEGEELFQAGLSAEHEFIGGLGSDVLRRNHAKVYPNPYRRSLRVSLSGVSGKVSLRLWSVSGVLLLLQDVELRSGRGDFELAEASLLPRQLMFLEVRFSDGERKVLKVSHE